MNKYLDSSFYISYVKHIRNEALKSDISDEFKAIIAFSIPDYGNMYSDVWEFKYKNEIYRHLSFSAWARLKRREDILNDILKK